VKCLENFIFGLDSAAVHRVLLASHIARFVAS